MASKKNSGGFRDHELADSHYTGDLDFERAYSRPSNLPRSSRSFGSGKRRRIGGEMLDLDIRRVSPEDRDFRRL